MTNTERIDLLLEKMQSTPLSAILTHVLPLALECGDYRGYALLAHWHCPVCEYAKANIIQRDEIVNNIMLCGFSKEEAKAIEIETAEQYLSMKGISDEHILAHSTKEIEEWLNEYKNIFPTVHSAEGIEKLNQRKRQLEQQYELLRSVIVSKLTNYRQLLSRRQQNTMNSNSPKSTDRSKVFIVHGHNGEMKEAVARLIEKQGIQAIILHEQANQGATIIEKFEKNSDVSGAVCLFTADDLGRAKADTEDKKRARQNVVFEAGYFIGKLGRENVILIADSGVEIPSDLQGVVYADSRNWRFSVLQELKAIGYSIDYNKLD